MAWRFHNAVPYAIPGILALLSCWWMYSHRKKHASCCDELATAMGEQQEEVTENDLLPQTEARVPQRLPLSSEEECPENETSTSLLSVGLMTPSLLCQTHERQDVSQDFSDLSVTTMQPSTLEDDSEKLETIGSQDESSVPACVTLPPVSESTEHHGSAAVSFPRDWSSTANQDQWPSVAVTLTEEPPGITEQISNAEQSDESSFKPPKELQMPESVLSNAGSVTALCLGLEKEANTPQVCLSDEVVSSHKNSAVSMLQDSSESASLEQSREEEMSESLVSTVPVCQEEDTQLKGDELEREKIGGVSLEKEEDEKIEQVAMQIISKVTLAATEELLSGSTSGMSTQICQAAASLVERPLEVASVVSSDLMPAKEAPAAEEKVTKEKVTVTSAPAALRTGEQGQSVADAGCSPGPVQGGTGHCRVKSCMCSKSAGAGRTPGKNRRGSLKKVLLVTEDSEGGTHMSEGGTSVEGSLQSTELSVASGQLLDWLSMSVTQDVSGEQSSVPSEEPSGALELPKDRKVPYSNGTLKEDGPHLYYECRWATAMDGDHSQGLDENSVDSVDSGNATKKTVTHQKLQGESSKSDFVIWEIEVPQELVGRLIGKQGRFMSFLRQASGAKIYVSTPPYFSDSQVCHIEGSMHQVEKVLRIIGKKFKELCLTNIYAVPPPAPLTLHSLLRTTWLLLPDGVTVEVVVANQVDAGHMFLQQHTHPTFHVLRILDQQMYTCYSQPEIPTLTIPVEVGIICAAPGLDGAWLRAQVTKYFKETNEVELKYVDYGGYDKVKVDTLRQIRSDFLSLPFQGAEVFLDNVVPLSDEDCFSSEANATVSEMTRGAVLVAQVTNYDSATGLPLIQLWNLMGGEVVSVNRTLVERGFARWLDY